MRVRLVRTAGADLNVFEFDYDLTWAVFLMNGSGKVYGRYGGRDAKGPDTRNSLEGLHFAMAAALEEHRKNPAVKPELPAQKPLYAENTPTAKKSYNRGCIHCHQVAEILREEEKIAGTWLREKMFPYPMPENVGITLDIDRGNLVKAVKPDSQAAKAGLKPGDLLQTLNKIPVHSFADASYGLHKAPFKGQIAVTWQARWQEAGRRLHAGRGMARTNITWRPSLMDLLPTLPVSGSDLTPKEKKALGLDGKRMALRQETPIHAAAYFMGVREGDIILGVDDKLLEMPAEQFPGYVRQNYLIGEALTINLLRNGKRLNLTVKLK